MRLVTPGRTTNRLAFSLGVALCLTTLVSAHPSAHAADPPRTLAFGAFPQVTGNQTQQQATQQLEAKIGRPLEVVRVFDKWSDTFPDAFDTWLANTDHTIILSIKPVRAGGAKVTWPSLANAAPGSTVDNEIRSWARRIRDFGHPIYVTLNHEPEASANTAYGTANDYINAWRHWVDVFRQEGASNVRFMLINTSYGYSVPTSDRRYAPKWYPGDAWVDSMGIDAYNWAECRPNQDNAWKTLANMIEPFRQFGALHPTKPIWLTEWASWDDPGVPGRKAQWIDQAKTLFAQPAYSQFVGLSYFNSAAINADFPDCDWWVDTSASSLASFAAMATDPLWSGDAFGEPPDPPPVQNPVFRSASSANTSGTAASVQVPVSVVAGDRLILIVTANTATTATVPTGWTLLSTQSEGTPADMSSWVFTRLAASGTGGTTVTSTLAVSSKSSRIVMAYSSAGAPTATSAVAGPSTTAHSTPSATVVAGSAVISYWSDKTSANTGWSLPVQVQSRATSIGTSTGRITAAAGDSSATGNSWAGASASSTASSAKAIMWTIVVPAAGPPPPNQNPTAAFTSSCTGLTCTFSATTSSDSDGTIASASWDFGDTTTAQGLTTSHTFGVADTYAVTVTVTDDDGATDSIAHNVAVSPVAATPITFVAQASTNTNTAVHRVVVPASVQAGDALILAFTSNNSSSVGSPLGITGWQLLGAESNGSMSTRIWARVATAGSAGTEITVTTSTTSKGNFVLAAYRGTSTVDPVASFDSSLESTSRTTHTTPAVQVTSDGAWVVWYWAHKDNTTSTLVAPAGTTVRSNGSQTGSGRVTGLLADSNAAVGIGTATGKTATAATANVNATMWSIVLTPA